MVIYEIRTRLCCIILIIESGANPQHYFAISPPRNNPVPSRGRHGMLRALKILILERKGTRNYFYFYYAIKYLLLKVNTGFINFLQDNYFELKTEFTVLSIHLENEIHKEQKI